MAKKKIYVIKATGQREPFSEKKVRRSIRRAGIPRKLEDQVVEHVKSRIYNNIPTYEVYQHISEFLGKSSRPYSKAVYSLKNSIMQLGPSGFPFEIFVAAVLSHHNFKVKTNAILKGNCVEHEVDIVAEKDGKQLMIECKFHNRSGARSDLKVALYVQARFEDLNSNSLKSNNSFNEAWLITNTKATTEAIKYAECLGMKIIGWGYPKSGNLQELVESRGLHPLTSLSSLTQDQKKQLLRQGVVLCRDLLIATEILKDLGVSKEQIAKVSQETEAICQIN